MKVRILFFVIPLCLSVLSCSAQHHSSPVGEPPVEENRALLPFEGVVISGGGDIFFYYAPSATLEVKGTSSRVEKVNTTVSSNTLYITSKNGSSEEERLKMYIGTPVLKDVRLQGGGRIKVKEGFAPVDEFRCTLEGGGTVDMVSLKIDSLFASIEGGGEISAWVSERLQGKIRGGGLILYQGRPVVESAISGGGAIRRK